MKRKLLLSSLTLLFFSGVLSLLQLKNQTIEYQVDPVYANFNYDEVVKKTIGINGGVLQDSQGLIVVTIPPLDKETEFTLSFRQSDFQVRSGVRSPVTFSLSPDKNFEEPIEIKISYDITYEHSIPVPYLVDEQGLLHLAQMVSIDRENNAFFMSTFHGGDYSWTYAEQ